MSSPAVDRLGMAAFCCSLVARHVTKISRDPVLDTALPGGVAEGTFGRAKQYFDAVRQCAHRNRQSRTRLYVMTITKWRFFP